jgi:hypothetical protein
MDSANNLSNSFKSSNVSMSSLGSISETGSGIGSASDSGIFEGIKSVGITTWIIIIFILAFLGFNVFTYLAEGTQEITNIFLPLVQSVTSVIRYITGETLSTVAEGGKVVVNASTEVVTSGLNTLDELGEDITPDGALMNSSLNNGQVSNTIQQIENADNNTLNKAINTTQVRQSQNQNLNYEADEANSSIQGGGKSGWCYIGEDRGFRTCALVGVNDTCMSGDIFPTQEICVNPNLRY